MTSIIEQLLYDPARYFAAFDGDHLAFRTMTRDSYARSIFLDQRIVAADEVTTRAPVLPLAAGARQLGLGPQPLHFIFHVAHCGSTLLARALERGAANLVLREPQALRQLGVLAAEHARAAPPAEWRSLARLACALLGKRYRPDAPVIVKANVPVNFMVDWLLAELPPAPALFLYHRFEEYLLAILRSDDHRAWVLQVGGDLYPALEPLLDPLDALEPARVAAALWLAQMRIYDAALARHPLTRSLDADTFYARPAEVLDAAFALFGMRVSSTDARAIAVGPLFGQYAKDPTMVFDETVRRQRRVEVRARLTPEIADARAWLDDRLASFPVPEALGRPLIGQSLPLL